MSGLPDPDGDTGAATFAQPEVFIPEGLRHAAPDLLEVARMATNACDVLADECRDEGDAEYEAKWRRKAEIARAAIAKAEVTQ